VANAVATSRAAAARDLTLADRFLAAVPLLSIFFWLGVLYTWEAWRHGTPWLFGDELELTQLSRSIAETGHPARRGDPYTFKSLYTYLMAPAWLLDDVHQAYATIRYLGVILMTLTVFPAYGIARMIVGKWPALFVAAGSAAIPAVAYAPILVEEPLAYPYATLTLFVVLKALVVRGPWWIAGAVVASFAGVFVRDELVVLVAAFALAACFLAWASERGARWRARWRRSDWVGVGVLLVGIGVAASAFIGHHNTEWLIATDHFKHRVLTLGLRAGGALTIGLGVLPLVAGLASLWPVRGERRTLEVTAFRSLLAGSVIAFGLYTATKAAYVSATFGTYTYERNLIYLAPLLFAGTALWLERRAVHPLAVGVAGAFALYLVLTTPYEMGQDSSYNAPGLAILQQSNRWFALTPAGAKILLGCLLAASVAVLLAPRLVRRGAAWLAGAVAGLVLVWNLTGEIGFANASNRSSNGALANIGRDPTWLDEHTHGTPAVFLGQQVGPDQNSEWLLEFWNRSLKEVWSVDGTAQGPGPTLTPDVRKSDGALVSAHRTIPQYRYVVTDRGVDVAGKVVAQHRHRAGGGFATWRLIRADHPLRLSAAVTGLYPDGWSGTNDTAYTRYTTRGDRPGKLAVKVSWKSWGGKNTARVRVRMGELRIGKDNQPHLGRVTGAKNWVIHAYQTQTFLLPAPGPSFRVEVRVNPKFQPNKLDPSRSDARLLGAVVSYRFIEPRRTGR
jgi:hypothetical protein